MQLGCPKGGACGAAEGCMNRQLFISYNGFQRGASVQGDAKNLGVNGVVVAVVVYHAGVGRGNVGKGVLEGLQGLCLTFCFGCGLDRVGYGRIGYRAVGKLNVGRLGFAGSK